MGKQSTKNLILSTKPSCWIDDLVMTESHNSNIKAGSSWQACNQRLFVTLIETFTHLKQHLMDAVMASLMGIANLHREVGQGTRDSGT